MREIQVEKSFRRVAVRDGAIDERSLARLRNVVRG
jgi:hypothetical protein